MNKPVPRITTVNAEYFAAAARGELHVRQCHNCGARFRPLSAWCPACFSPKIGWLRASGRAIVTHFTVVHQPPTEAFETPYVLALVDLEEGVRMMTNIVNCATDSVFIGMKVNVTFQARENVVLPMFEPR